MKKIIAVTLSILTLAACARDLSSDVYTSDSTLSLTLQGKIISARPITIKNSDQLSDNTGGMLAGGALGAVAGSNMGGGNGQAAAVVGGALVGAAAGAVAQGSLGKSEGFEYIIKVDTKNLKSDYYEGSASMRNAISSATTSGLVTVVQGKDVALNKGQSVYVIFSDKRTRVISAN
ncbi:MAG: pcp [Rickettsiaceae bacterium]|nr:pcp [Rickettsiaceae bacterium]